MSFMINRVDRSRAMIENALNAAYGSYIEQEGKKKDSWRDQTIGQLGDHIRHEIEEVMGNIRRGEIGFLMHNAMDIIELGAMLLAKAGEAAGNEVKALESGGKTVPGKRPS